MRTFAVHPGSSGHHDEKESTRIFTVLPAQCNIGLAVCEHYSEFGGACNQGCEGTSRTGFDYLQRKVTEIMGFCIRKFQIPGDGYNTAAAANECACPSPCVSSTIYNADFSRF